MSEIEKMYENVGIEPTHYDACTLEDKYWKDGSMQNLYGTFDSYLSFECPHYGEGCYSTCEYAYDKDEYPPFTAEKQLEITKLIGIRYGLKFITNEGMDYMLSTDLYNNNKFDKQGYGYGYDEAIANLVNNLWQDLTEEEKQQVKGILEVE